VNHSETDFHRNSVYIFYIFEYPDFSRVYEKDIRMEQYRTHVLIIDDEEPFCVVTSDTLEISGYRVNYALSVEDGIKYIQKDCDVDIILLDINLGWGMSGVEAIPFLRNKFPYIQIIMITSIDALDVGIHCMKRGAYDYLTKPFDEEKFFKIAEKAIERKKISQLNDLYFKTLVHDLKNPLQNIKMAVNTFLHKEKTTQGEKDLLSLAHYSTWQIDTMINNILTIPKLEEKRLTIKKTEFLLEPEIEEKLKPLVAIILLTKRSFTMRTMTGKNYVLKTDKEFFFQIIGNILGNAIRFTPDGGKITITMEESEDSFLKISMTNTGSYIEEGLRDKIFDKYFQDRDNENSPVQNFGLGLTYNKLAVEVMGGKIWVESNRQPPETTFYFTVKNFR
jgi:two-component system, sensor histidine kinase and response regulator